MKLDAVILIDQADVAHRFYPIALTQPVPNIIAGGLRLFEHVILEIQNSLKTTPSIIVCTREHLAFDWKHIIKYILTEELLDLKIELKYISRRELLNELNRYDTIMVLPGNVISIPEHLINELTLSTRKCDWNTILTTLRNVKASLKEENVVQNMYDIIKKNLDLLSRVFKLFKNSIKESKLVIESEISEPAVVEKMCVLYRCKVQPFSYIRSGTVLYPETVVGGEVKNSIIDVYTHKEHYGYIGDSYVGRFVNFGAGTTISNLKNTKGSTKVLGVDTGLVKLGVLMGDHVKTAIGTLIYSGKTVGPYSHVYGLVAADVPPLTIYREGATMEMSLEKLIAQLQRWCSKYIGNYVEYEIKILKEVYAAVTSFHECGPNELSLYFK